MTLNDRSSPLSLLATRRSGRPRDLAGPGPTDDELRQILAIASRTPDHGQLVPYRFVIVGADQRDALAKLYSRALSIAEPNAPEAKVAKAIANARAAPALAVLISKPVPDHKIPIFEQEQTCGAAGMNFLHAATALGYAAGWITGWPATNPTVSSAFCGEGERIAGFLYVGTPVTPLDDRVRPSLDAVASNWVPPAE
ncbi:nitroreductase [Sphingomonas sp. HDW15A]|uniref:nitroreductase family protein n=1 Tax=Sphingomonas sp. HDW15A TaxID=2714942 RepID=UPI001407ABA6|nr:nitroreductase [Sphingomonas sp. HDW15A]QIK95694.1 nitroreductase [Sphingomonas sp. HDW15A]